MKILLKTSENPLKTSETLPLRDPLRGRFPSQRLSVLLPLIVLPLSLSPRIETARPHPFMIAINDDLGRPLMHHQNVPLKNAPSKRTLLTSFQRSPKPTLHQIWCGLWGQHLLAGVVPQGTSEKRSKEYVLMVHFLVVRFDGASGACQKSLCSLALEATVAPEQAQPKQQLPTRLGIPNLARGDGKCTRHSDVRELGTHGFQQDTKDYLNQREFPGYFHLASRDFFAPIFVVFREFLQKLFLAPLFL